MNRLPSPEAVLDWLTRSLALWWLTLAMPLQAGRLAAIHLATQRRLVSQQQYLRADLRLLQSVRDELRQMEALVAEADLSLGSSKHLLVEALHLSIAHLKERLQTIQEHEELLDVA